MLGLNPLFRKHNTSHKHYFKFVGLAPIDGVTAQDQRDDFARRLHEQFGIPEIQTDDWAKLFSLLAPGIQKSRVILFFDELSWMAQDDPTFSFRFIMTH